MKRFLLLLLFSSFVYSEDCDYKNINSSSFTYKNTYESNGYLKGDYYVNGNLVNKNLTIVALSQLSTKLQVCESEESAPNPIDNVVDSSASDAQKLGLTEQQFNNQMATMANNIGFTLVFLMCFLAVLVMRK